MFGFIWKSQAFCFEKSAVVLRELIPSVPPMVSVVIFLGLGAAGGTLISRCQWFHALWVVLLFSAAGGLVVLSSQLLRVRTQTVAMRRLAWWALLVGMAFGMCCWAWCCARLFSRDELAWSLTESAQPILVEGSVIAAPERMRNAQGILDTGRLRETSVWVLELSSARNFQRWVPVSGRASVFVDGKIQLLPIGTHVRVYGRAMRPSSPDNSGEFDFRQSSRASRVLTIIRVRDWSSIVVLPDGVTLSVSRYVDWLRQLCRNRIHVIVPVQSQPLADSLLLGLRRALPEQTIRTFADTGCIHILAISGLHVGLVATAIFSVLRFSGCPFRTNWLIVACVISIYAGLTGAALPVLRATLLLWVACAGVWMKRRFSGIHALAVVGVILLVWNPVSVLAAGTQLSFLATAVLITVGALLREQSTRNPTRRIIEKKHGFFRNTVHRFSHSLWCAVLLSFSVWVVSVPLVASEFHRFVPVAVGTNLLIGPILPFVMAAGFACLVTVGLPVAVCAPLGVLTGFLFESLTCIVTWVASFTGSTLRVYALPTWWVVIWYVAVTLLLLHLCDRSKAVQRSQRRCCGRLQKEFERSAYSLKIVLLGIFLFGFVVLGIGLQWMPEPARKESRMTITAMGHGCGIVLKSREGRCLIYDAGRLGASGTALRSLRATLVKERIRTIDYLVLSHADTDHFNGVPGLLEEFCVKQVILSPQFLASSSRSVAEIRRLLVKHEVPVRTVLSGDVITVGQSCVARVLHPQRGSKPSEVSDNENSIVLDVTIESKRVLLTGDIEGDSLRALLCSGLPFCDILIAPHHGSKTGLPREIVSEVHPNIVIVSGSGGRDWDFVSREFHQGWNGLRAVLRTAGELPPDRGAVSITMSDDMMTIEQFRSTGWQRIL
ncbi:MAG: ComEC/Rec2 family competence protein [Pirellulales bacterium]